MARERTATNEIPSHVLGEADAAAYLAMSTHFLRAARQGRGEGPPYVRFGRSVRYRLGDLERWLESRVVSR